MNAIELERNGCCCFFYLHWGNVVLWLKRTSTKKLANGISYQIWYKGCLKGKFGRGSKSAKGGPYPLADLNWWSKSAGGPNPRGVQIRCDTGFFETPKDIDDFTNCPTHRWNLGVGWNRGSNSRCRVSKEMSGHDQGRVKSNPNADRGIGKHLSQILLKMSNHDLLFTY